MGPLRPAVPSLRSAFVWSFAGNVVNGFSAWAVLALVARLTSIESLGQYALAVAVASPVAMLAHLNLRMVLATDVSGEHSDADYFQVRMWSAAAGLVITAAIGFAWQPFLGVGLTIILVGANFAVENIEDLYYAVMQRSERLDHVARSMVLRGVLGIALIAVLLRMFPVPASAAGGMLLSRIITLLSYDVRKATASAGNVTAPREVFLRAAPLGLTLMLVSFTSAIPRYVVEHWLGPARLGAFAAVMSFIAVGSVMINALGQSATTRLARSFRSGDWPDFRRLALRLCALAVGIGLTGAIIAAIGGSYFLKRVYRPELAEYQPLLVQALLAGTIGYVAAILGFVVSSTRRFTEQLPLLTLVAFTSGAVSLIAVPAIGLSGSVLAVAAAASSSDRREYLHSPRGVMSFQRVALALVAALAFTLPWEKSVTFAGIGTVARAVGMLAFVAGVVYVLRSHRHRRPNLALLLLTVLVLWSAATWFWSYDPQATSVRISTFVQLLAMVWLVWNVCRSAIDGRVLVSAVLAGAVIASLTTIARYLEHTQTYWRRYAAPGFDPNDLGLTLALTLPLCIWLMNYDRWRWLAIASGLLSCSAILLTASRTALVCAFLGLLLANVSWKSAALAARLGQFTLVVFLLLGTTVLAPKASRERVATTVQETTTGTLHKRTTIWKAGLSAWKSRRFIGVGSGAYPDAVRPIIGTPGVPGHEYVAHNSHLSILVETGLIGFAIYAGLLLSLAIFVFCMQGADRAVWGTVLLIWVVGVSTLTWEHRKIGWLLFAILMTEWARAWRADEARPA